MTVGIQEIRRIAALARLRLEEGEAARMARDMTAILDHMAVLGRAALESPSAPDVPESEDAARPDGKDPDEAGQPAEAAETVPDPLARPLSRLAPDWREGFFVVPRLPGVTGASHEADGPS